MRATDPNGTFPTLSASNLPTFATFQGSGYGRGILFLWPDYTHAGTYNVEITASDGEFTATETITITVTGVNRYPVLAAIGNQTVGEGQELDVALTASDENGTIPTLSASGATFVSLTDNGDGTGTLTLAPQAGDVGVYSVTVTATDAVDPSLTDSETIAVTVRSLVAHWQGDGDGTDATGYGHDGSLHGGIGFAPGIRGQAFSFDGVDDYVRVPKDVNNPLPYGSSPRSMALWAYTQPSSWGRNGRLFHSGEPTTGKTFGLIVREYPDMEFSTWGNDLRFDADVPQEGWVHVTVVYDGTEVRVYTQGQLRASKAYGALTTSLTDILIGRWEGGGPFDGLIDDVRIYNYPLSEAEIADLVNVNYPPVLSAIGDRTVAEGHELDVVVTASDENGTIPTLSASGADFVSLTDNGDGTGTLHLAPQAGDVGVYSVTITATDAVDPLLTDSETVQITVTNQPPVLAAIGDRTVIEGQELDVALTASDEDDTNPTLSTSDLPGFATFRDDGDGTGMLLLTPRAGDAGVYSVTVTATDAVDPSLTDSETVQITVTNQPPVLAAIGDRTVIEGQELDVALTASDEDDTNPTLSTSDLPGFATFRDDGDGTGMLLLTPRAGDAGVYPVTVTATDAVDPSLVDSETIQITVLEPGLLAHWKGDGNATDATGNGHKGSLHGGIGFDPGVLGQAFSLDGNGYVEIEKQVDFARGDYSLAGWFNVSSYGNDHTLFAATNQRRHGVMVAMQSDGRLRYLHRSPPGNSGGTSVRSPGPVGWDTWHHFAAVKEGSALKLYLDGNAVGSGTDAGGFYTAFDVVLGRLYKENADRAVKGLLDDVRIYSYALSETEIVDIAGLSPTVSITTTTDDPTRTSPISVTITFSEPVSGFEASDLVIGNGSAANLSTPDGQTYTVDITPVTDVRVTVDVGAGVAQDASGNPNEPATQFVIRYDGTEPTVSITSTADDPTRTSPISATITFSEPVSGFEVSDLVVGNGNAANLSASDDKTYTVNITPVADGQVTVNVGAGVVEDAAGNPNEAANQFSVVYDDTEPTVEIYSPTGDPLRTSPITLLVAFSEPVNGFTASDVDVGNGSVDTVRPYTGNNYWVDIIPEAQSQVTVDMRAGVVEDAAGNPNQTATQFSVVYDPVPTLSITTQEGGSTNKLLFDVTITFSEPVIGFTEDDIEVKNGTIHNLRDLGGNAYKVDIVPAEEGIVFVGVPMNSVEDATGNLNNTGHTEFTIQFEKEFEWETVVTGLTYPSDLFVDGDNLYFSDSPLIYKASKGSTGLTLANLETVANTSVNTSLGLE